MYKDLTGRKFGRLTVVERSGSDAHRNVRWLCRCTCGKVCFPNSSSLLLGRSNSCGCLQIEASRGFITIGRNFGKLKVFRFAGTKNSRSMYECKCKCGNTKVVQAHRLLNGTTTSCGCYRRESSRARVRKQNTTHGLSGTAEYQRAQGSLRRARKRSVGGRYSAEDVSLLLRAQRNRCFYCENTLGDYHVDHMTPLVRGGSNGIENICIACPDCNLKKSTKTAEEFLFLMRSRGGYHGKARSTELLC